MSPDLLFLIFQFCFDFITFESHATYFQIECINKLPDLFFRQQKVYLRAYNEIAHHSRQQLTATLHTHTLNPKNMNMNGMLLFPPLAAAAAAAAVAAQQNAAATTSAARASLNFSALQVKSPKSRF